MHTSVGCKHLAVYLEARACLPVGVPVRAHAHTSGSPGSLKRHAILGRLADRPDDCRRRSPAQGRAAAGARDRNVPWIRPVTVRAASSEPGGEDASEGCAAALRSGQPVDAIGDGSGERKQKCPEAGPNVARRYGGISLNWITSINSDKPTRMAWVCPLYRH